MTNIGNFARDVATGVPFTSGNATIKDAAGSTIASPALNGTTGRWEYIANGQPGIITQTYVAAGQTKIVAGDAFGQAGTIMEAELQRVLLLFGDGVIDGGAVTAPGGMAVQVGLGDFLNKGVLHPIYTAENVTIAAAHATLPRLDTIVSRLTRTGTFAGKVVLAVLAGSPGASPLPTGLTQDATTWEVEVARVTVPAAAGSIVTGNISTATRPIATGPLSDGSVTLAKLAADSVDSSKIVDGSVALVDLATGVIVPGLFPGLIATYWTSALNILGGDRVAIDIVQNVLYGAPVFIPKATTLTGLAVNRSGGTTASATARLGLYSTGSNGMPAALHTDAGTVSISTTGIKSITGLSAPLAAGWYWATVCCGTFTGSLPLMQIRSVEGGGLLIMRSLLGDPTPGLNGGLYGTQGVFVGTGALPASYPSPGVSAGGPLVWVQTSGT